MSFRLVPKSVTLNGVISVILRYFAEFVYDVVVKQFPRFQNLLLIVYEYMTILIIRYVQLFSDYLGKTNCDNSV